MFEDNPAMHQWASALVGGVVSEIVAKNAQAGASTAASATKNNYLFHDQIKQRDEELRLARERGASEEEIKKIEDKWAEIDAAQDEALNVYGYPAGEIFDSSSPSDIEIQNNIKKYAQWLLLPDSTKSALQNALGSGASSVVAGIVDKKISENIIDNLQEQIKINGNAQGLPYINYVVNVTPGSSIVLKGVAKVGVINIGKTAYSIYLNGENYDNISDFTKASACDIVGLGVTTAIGAGLTGFGCSVGAVIISGVVVGYIVDYSIEQLKPNR